MQWWQTNRFWLGLAVTATFIVMLPNLDNGWVNWDDQDYVQQNTLIQSLTPENVAAMFSKAEFKGNYHPLTLLSLALDYAIYGQKAPGYHLANVLLHIANVALVFWFIFTLSRHAEVAGMVALLFGIHPMHLESVAWISARKDMLYSIFFLLGLLSYLRYLSAKNAHWRPYLLTFLFFLLSLLSKAMAVTFPLILLSIDYLQSRQNWRRQWLEKMPFFALSLSLGIVAVMSQQDSTALPGVREIDLIESSAAAGYGLLMYLIKVVVPIRLSAFHPYPMPVGESLPLPFWVAGYATVAIVLALIIILRNRRRLFFGAVFFLVSIAPVLQFLPVGQALYAERYTYLAYIGLFYCMAVGISVLQEKSSALAANVQKIGAACLVGYVVILGVLTFARSDVWQNGETLWSDVIEKYPADFFAYGTRASYYAQTGDSERALADYNSSVQLLPTFFEGYNNRGLIFFEKREFELALADFNKAIELDPKYADAWTNRGLIFLNSNRYDQAFRDFTRAIELQPGSSRNYYNRGIASQRLNQLQAALADFSKAITLDPNQPKFYKDRGFTHGLLNQYQQAIADFSRAIALDPGYAEAYFWRSAGYRDLGQFEQARRDALKARELGYRVTDSYFDTLRDRANQ